MLPAVRVLVAIVALAILLAGLVATAAGAGLPGLWAMATGAIGLLAVAFERSRYRSEAAERSAAGQSPGPGGGETDIPGSPFQPTEERFVDPTTGRRMRVYLNPSTGERRYHAER